MKLVSSSVRKQFLFRLSNISDYPTGKPIAWPYGNIGVWGKRGKTTKQYSRKENLQLKT